MLSAIFFKDNLSFELVRKQLAIIAYFNIDIFKTKVTQIILIKIHLRQDDRTKVIK